jgi:flagellar biogenesis protein FliO
MMPPFMTIGGSLAVVLSLFFVAAWLLKRGMPRGALALPSEVVEVLGSTALPSRQQAYLVRCGSKLLLVAVGTAGSETLTEITDPVEVDRLAGICRQAHPQSATAAFRNILHQFGGEQDDDFGDKPIASRRLPAASIVSDRQRGREDADV